MKKKIEPLSANIIEGISKILGDTNSGLTGSEINHMLRQSRLKNPDPTTTKWKRIYNSFVEFQYRNKTSNNIFTFILNATDPSRFINKSQLFNEQRDKLNQQLSFVGFQISEEGKLQKVRIAKTIDEAEQRANQLRTKLEKRGAHNEIFKYCKAELLSNNYFHTVFEAVKSIAERIRNKSQLLKDGSALIDEAFSISNPRIRINNLSNETMKSEHKGFANLIKGVFGMFRNTTAHAPKITWNITEEDALDILSTISLIHRKLDKAI